jgi:predicted enzyme related to lactoylglutathione lyase
MQLLVNIDVADLTAAERFYSRAFDLHAGRRLGDNVLELLGAAVPIYLLQKAGGTPGAGGSERDYARHWTPLHCDVVVEDLDGAMARAIAAGAAQEGDIREAPWGTNRAAGRSLGPWLVPDPVPKRWLRRDRDRLRRPSTACLGSAPMACEVVKR